jgi:hypothetical protein
LVRRNFSGKKGFQKIQDDFKPRFKLIFFYFSRHLGFFEKLLFHKICVLPTPNQDKNKIVKTLYTTQNNAKKFDFDLPLWIELGSSLGSNRLF